MTITEIAQVVHEIQRAFCKSLDDHSLPDWEDSIGMQKTTIAGVQYLINNPKAGAGSSHREWCKAKEAEGWKYGPVKDWGKKEHPSMIDFALLPLIERQKDVLFVQTVRSLIKFLSL